MRYPMKAVLTRKSGELVENAYGHKMPSGETVQSEMRCRAQVQSEMIKSNDKRYMAMTYVKLWASLAADVRHDDIITRIERPNGEPFIGNRLRVVSVVERETHHEVMAEEYA